MQVLVLGATGIIGGHVVRAAARAGYHVRAFARPSSPRLALEGVEAEVVLGDLEDIDSLIAAMRGCAAVIHAAGYYPATPEPRTTHIARAKRHIRNVLEATRQAGISRLVYTSSISTIGIISPNRLGTEDDYYWPGQMIHPYWDCKWIQEQAVLTARDIDVVVLIPSAVFGPGDVKPATGAMVLALARTGTWVAPTGRVNVVDVRDVAQAHVTALTRGRPGERYLLGGHNVTLPKAYAVIARALGHQEPILSIPSAPVSRLTRPLLAISTWLRIPGGVSLAYMLEAIRAAQWIDSAKAARELGLRPRPLAETMSDAVAWFRDHGYFQRPLRSLAMGIGKMQGGD